MLMMLLLPILLVVVLLCWLTAELPEMMFTLVLIFLVALILGPL